MVESEITVVKAESDRYGERIDLFIYGTEIDMAKVRRFQIPSQRASRLSKMTCS